LICFALLLSTLVIPRRAAASGANGQGQAGPPGGGQKVDPPRPIEGAPGVGLPNTDALLRRPRLTTPIIQPAIPSTQRRYRHPRLSNRASLGGRGDIGDAERAAAESERPASRQSNSTSNSKRNVRLAFPVVDGYLYYNSQAGAYYYLLFTSSGQRVELRRTATANVYEAVDSSYLQLTDYWQLSDPQRH
jgi:hypothetical protein